MTEFGDFVGFIFISGRNIYGLSAIVNIIRYFTFGYILWVFNIQMGLV